MLLRGRKQKNVAKPAGSVRLVSQGNVPGEKPVNLGARVIGKNSCEFMVWAPCSKRVELHIITPKTKLVPLVTDGSGYHWTVLSDVEPGTEYLFRLNSGLERPDPASRCQPHGVHGPSAVVDPVYNWKDKAWKGLPLERFVIYELHTGTFSPEGTFAGIIPRLDILKDLGVTVIELMPIAQFPGARNWGYDGVYPFAAQQSYGGVKEFKRLIDACHQRGLAVILDVVYNHLGPEGNYLRDFGPYFTRNYRTPWGEAINFDGPDSDEVRRFFLESARRWVDEFHVDALRLDAVDAIRDYSVRHFVEELAAAAHEIARARGRRIQIIAESGLNDPRVIRPSAEGGWGCDAQYCRDFHHSLHVALTGERSGQYRDFAGLVDLARSYSEAFVYTGQYSARRRRSHGRAADGRPASQFLVFAQEHDEVGNRPFGERLSVLTDFEALKLAAGAVALSPFVPFLFMGEEYGEEAPFFYFTSHSDKRLAEAVRLGRHREFNLAADKEKIPDPNAESIFLRSRLNQGLRRKGRHAVLQNFYRRLYALRREHPALARLNRENLTVSLYENDKALIVSRRAENEEVIFALHFAKSPGRLRLKLPEGTWTKLLDSAETKWGGPGSPAAERLAGGQTELALASLCVVLYGKEITVTKNR
ncbi:MAG TPA: malto-oligosyltrehalose trehalohydrolase [Elusimicrobia bacterium]|nr:malto-oligosyltrehalose trehalohydrolase [Elusimicrobiota bacterium]